MCFKRPLSTKKKNQLRFLFEMSCETFITFNHGSTGCFYAGDIVTGTVVMKVQEKQKMENFKVVVTGICKASWTRPIPTIPYIKLYSESRKVLSFYNDIFTDIEGKIVPSGTYKHPFYFALPPDLPPTFKNSIANVFYSITVQCKAAFKIKKKTTVSFNVSINLDLNHLERFLMPQFLEVKKKFWNSGKLTMQLQTFIGFAPNQTIHFQAIICNDSKVKLTKLSVTLVQQIEYNVSSGYLNEEKKIERICYNQFGKSGKEVCNFNLVVPQTTPSCNFPMIKIEYKLLVELELPYHFTLFKTLPVTISTVPVMHVELFK